MMDNCLLSIELSAPYLLFAFTLMLGDVQTSQDQHTSPQLTTGAATTQRSTMKLQMSTSFDFTTQPVTAFLSTEESTLTTSNEYDQLQSISPSSTEVTSHTGQRTLVTSGDL